MLSLACIAWCIAVKGEHWTRRAQSFAIDGLLVLCIVALINVGVRCGSWASQRWRNGSLRMQRLTAVEWAEQIVVVTGGGSGVGLAAVELLLAKGARVVSLGIYEPDAAQGKSNLWCCVQRLTPRRAAVELPVRCVEQSGRRPGCRAHPPRGDRRRSLWRDWR